MWFCGKKLSSEIVNAVNPKPPRSVHESLTPRAVARTAALASLILSLVLYASIAAAWGPFTVQTGESTTTGYSERKGMLEARAGYLWGTNQIRFRDGDNDLMAPGKKEISLESPVFGLLAETYRDTDFALRAQAWINLPQNKRSDWLMDRTARQWETQPRYLAGDLSVAYYLGLGGMPYSAGLAAGYRYVDHDYQSATPRNANGYYEDHLHVHIPYLGVFYGNGDFAGTVVRLDLHVSPLTMSRLDSEQHFNGVHTQVEGHSMTGLWFESLFSWCFSVGRGGLIGVFVNYSFMELSGGTTVRRTGQSTRFSLDSRSHLTMVGLTAAYSF